MKPFTVVAPLVAADGYGQSAEQLVLAALDLGADIQVVAWGHWDEREYCDPRLLERVVPKERIRDRETVVIHFLPFATSEHYQLRSERTILSTMFETDSIPPFWVPGCNAADGVIVPSEHCREAFEPHLDVPVRVVSLGVDTGFYQPVIREHGPPFTFLMAGLLHYRKGVDFAVRAFREEFPGDRNVQLVLKTRRGFLDANGEDLSDPRIFAITDDFTREQMRDLYGKSDCFLAPSRGEASGLTPREAMATGLPVILTDWGGLAEIAGPAWSFPVEVEALEPAPPQCSSYDANVAGHQPIGNFARPSVKRLRELMRVVYEDRLEGLARGAMAAAEMRRSWSWELCARVWLDTIATLSA